MAYQDLALPVDIPWMRLGASSDMMDTTFGDFRFPPKWRSSIAIFYYEPNEADLPETYCERKISYLKVVCSISGYQAGQEVGVTQPDLDGAWHREERALGDQYFPCYGALLQVAVFPPRDEKGYPLADYPYIVNFEPKRRELYEAVTKSGEILGRSASTLNLLKGATSADTTEIASKIGAEVSTGLIPALFVSGGVSEEHSNKHGTAFSENTVRTTDDSREKRETFSSTTSLTQMYELFTGYHLGSNRALFYMVSRPHTTEEKDQYTFVNGPRRLEGIQEIFLVVSRPKYMPGLCVEAFLETAHLFPEQAEPTPVVDAEGPSLPVDYDYHETPPIYRAGGWNFDKYDDDDGTFQDFTFDLFELPEGCEIDESRGGGQLDRDNEGLKWILWWPKGYHVEFDFNKASDGYQFTDGRTLWSISFEVVARKVTMKLTLRGRDRGEPRFSCKVIVYYRCPKPADPESTRPEETENKKTLFLTSRGLKVCAGLEKTEKSNPGHIDRWVDWDKVFVREGTPKVLAWLAEHQPFQLDITDFEAYLARLKEMMDEDPKGFRARVIEAFDKGLLDPLPQEWSVPQEWISFEAPILVSPRMTSSSAPARQRIRASNDLGRQLGELMIASLGSSHRYPQQVVNFWETDMVVSRLSRLHARMPDDHLDNAPLATLDFPFKELVISVFGDEMRRKDILRRSPTVLRRRLGISESEARELKAAVIRADLPIEALEDVPRDWRAGIRHAFPEARTRKEVLKIPLTKLCETLGISVKQAHELRLKLMGIAPLGDDGNEHRPKQNDGDKSLV